MTAPRLRVFAGPNGSGKSTLFEFLSGNYNTGLFLNADSIESDLARRGFIDLNDYHLNLTQDDLLDFFQTERARSLIEKSTNAGHIINFQIIDNFIVDKEKDTHSYEGALIAAFLREKIQEKKLDYCFETVMSHPSKIEEIKEARAKAYKTYLYFICIDDPGVNVSRVKNRVEKGGHDVAEDKIMKRYFKTLENLMPAIEAVEKAYLFDNSGENYVLLAKIKNKKLELTTEPEKLPNWFTDYVLIHYIR